MNTHPPFSAHPRQRPAIGFLQEFWTLDADGRAAYAEHGGVAESAQSIGSQNRQSFRLASDIAVNRSFSKVKALQAGTLVLRMVSQLQGWQTDHRGLIRRLIEVLEKHGDEDFNCRSDWL